MIMSEINYQLIFQINFEHLSKHKCEVNRKNDVVDVDLRFSVESFYSAAQKKQKKTKTLSMVLHPFALSGIFLFLADQSGREAPSSSKK